MVDLTYDAPPGVSAIQPVYTSEHRFGRAREASGEEALYLGAHTESLLFRETAGHRTYKLDLADLLVFGGHAPRYRAS